MNNNLFLQGGSLHGKFKDATPFRSSVKTDGEKSESKSASLVDELGVMLKEKGFNYHGCEVLYSGVYGTELTCEIFIGPVYYQRLRHMVSDKYQVSKFTVFPSYKTSNQQNDAPNFVLFNPDCAIFMLSSESERKINLLL
jgi:hypothetical protein